MTSLLVWQISPFISSDPSQLSASYYFLVGHVFLQQPYHPTYFALERLDQCMSNTYSHVHCPTIPQPVVLNSVCAAPCDEGEDCFSSSLTD